MPKTRTKGGSNKIAKGPQVPEGVALISVLLLFIIAIYSGSSITGAQTVDISTPDGMYQFLQEGSQNANQFNNQIPSEIKSLFGNERIIGEITLSSGELLTVSAVTVNARVMRFQKGEIQDPTLRLHTNEKTIKKILAAPDPARAVRAALDSKEIHYEAASLGGRVKYSSVSILSRVVSWFGW